MKAITLSENGRFKYAAVPTKNDLRTFPLHCGLLGINNKIYCTMYSQPLTDKIRQEYLDRGIFREDELDDLPVLIHLCEMQLTTRTHGDEYEDKSMDFRELYKWCEEHPILERDDELERPEGREGLRNAWVGQEDEASAMLPLGSDVFRNAANYAYQEIEGIKMDNFEAGFANSKAVGEFLAIFQGS